MNLLRGQSLQKTLMLLLLLTSSSALVLATLGFALNDWLFSRAEMIDRLRSQADIIANNTVAALTFNDQEAALRTLKSLQSETDIIGTLLFTNTGELFAAYQREEFELPAVMPQENLGYLDKDIYVIRPIEFGDEKLGNILLISQYGYWDKQQMMRMTTLIGLFLVALLFAFVISARLQRVVTQPILKLADTARRITQSQDYTLRAKKISKDEIGLLVDDFNEMVHQVQLRDNELNLVKAQLEDKVIERTTELEELASKFEHQAYHDGLTGLANRNTFDIRLRSAISQNKRYGGQLAVLFLDLDHFKMVNDTLGHAIGDKLLIEVSNRLSKCLRSSDTLARLGGDEFALLLPDIQPNITADVASKLIDAINDPMIIDGYNLHLTTSIGISTFPKDGDNAEVMLKNADTAMYRSKDQGRNRFTFFASEMNARAERRLMLESKLRKAIAEHSFELYYQPKCDVESLALVGVEALVRWYDKDEGFIDTSEFIDLAEECGLVNTIDKWVLEHACQEILSIYDNKCPEIFLSVNYSPSHFFHNNVTEEVASILKKTGFPGDRLELEITENLVGPAINDVSSQLAGIRALGIEISIDDFGTAYSSLSRLKQLPLNTLKIDRSFIRDLGLDKDDETIVRTIITMAHNLNLKVVAEGVETEAQYQFVKQHHCDIVQGYLFGKPMPLKDIEQLITTAPSFTLS